LGDNVISLKVVYGGKKIKEIDSQLERYQGILSHLTHDVNTCKRIIADLRKEKEKAEESLK
jgi:predicted RNase H-like nuclease (RuvC/YqgF family)